MDVLLCGLAALFLPKICAPFLMTLCLAFDLLTGIVSTYYFRLQDLPYLVHSFFLLPIERLVRYGAAALLILGVLGTASYLLRKAVVQRVQFRTALVLTAVILILVSLDVWNRYRLLRHPDTLQVLLLRFPEVTLAKQWFLIDKHADSTRPGVVQYSDSASEHGFALLGDLSYKPNIVEILVESWGDDQGSITKNLEENYRQRAIMSRYKLVTGTVPFWGPTVSGEIRELCHSTFGLSILHRNEPLPKNCIPSLLRQKGYMTEAIHGYFGRMFDRSRWYPLIGFDRMLFKDNFHAQGVPDCVGAFAFPGICDSQISTWIGNQLVQVKTPIFIYWVTLNSHLPVPATINRLNSVSCNFDSQVRGERSLCSWFKLEYEVHESVASMVSRSDLPPTAFFIVGDHAPPFADMAIRDRFSTRNVPFVLLIPKQFIKNSVSEIR